MSQPSHYSLPLEFPVQCLYIAWSTAMTVFSMEVLPDEGHSMGCRPGRVRALKFSLQGVEDARVFVVTGPRMCIA